jgi:hypothetical protein
VKDNLVAIGLFFSLGDLVAIFMLKFEGSLGGHRVVFFHLKTT